MDFPHFYETISRNLNLKKTLNNNNVLKFDQYHENGRYSSCKLKWAFNEFSKGNTILLGDTRG